jgi:hypothetical protein
MKGLRTPELDRWLPPRVSHSARVLFTVFSDDCWCVYQMIILQCQRGRGGTYRSLPAWICEWLSCQYLTSARGGEWY